MAAAAGAWLAYVHAHRPALTLSGVDIDPRKIALARSCTRLTADLSTVSPQAPLPDACCTVLTCVDVLYLLPDAEVRELLGRFLTALKPGGMLLLKETCDTPRAKYQLTRYQEMLAVKVFRFTAGSGVRIKPLASQLDMVASCGYEHVRARRIDQGYPHPSVLIRAHKPLRPAGT